MRQPHPLGAPLAGLAALLLLGANPQDKAAADALFRAGREAADKGDHATACARFRESDRLDPAFGTKFNLADCEERLGHVVAAWTLHVELIEKLPPSDERLAVCRERRAALEKRLPRLVVRRAPAAAGAAITRDGDPLGEAALGIAIPIEPGAHRLVVTAPGREPREYPVQAVEGVTTELDVEPGPPTAPVRPTAAATATATTTVSARPVTTAAPGGDPAPWQRTLGFVTVGVGALSLVAGGVTGGLALGYKGELDSLGCNGKTCPQASLARANEIASAGSTVEKISTAGFIVGGVAAAAGVVLILTSPKGRSVQVAPAASLHGPGLHLQGAF